MARIELWNGDICDLEVDAIVSPAALRPHLIARLNASHPAGRGRA